MVSELTGHKGLSGSAADKRRLFGVRTSTSSLSIPMKFAVNWVLTSGTS